MEVYQAIRSRRTGRDYKPDPIPQELIKKILQCARWSPSSSNTQKWSFIAIQNLDTLSELGNICKQGPFVGPNTICRGSSDGRCTEATVRRWTSNTEFWNSWPGLRA
ncbi:MAG: hypothetical protein CM1200mP22_29970 [Dehalococcoidia bacterium]|nr:MAG: hypothetical protein CM1200mP22_29970 [Dehalococcoidia bacterium]